MKNVEIELKLPLINSADVEAYLSSSAKFEYESFQHDIYFNPPHKNFVENLDNVCEWLRIRVSAEDAQINYKDWKPHDEKVKTYCIEYETKISSYEQFRYILDALNFVELVEVKKTRRVWTLGDVEISIDSVVDLGEFVEIEYKGSNIDVNQVRDYLFSFIDKIGAITKDVDLKGYPFLMLEKKIFQ